MKALYNWHMLYIMGEPILSFTDLKGRCREGDGQEDRTERIEWRRMRVENMAKGKKIKQHLTWITITNTYCMSTLLGNLGTLSVTYPTVFVAQGALMMQKQKLFILFQSQQIG